MFENFEFNKETAILIGAGAVVGALATYGTMRYLSSRDTSAKPTTVPNTPKPISVSELGADVVKQPEPVIPETEETPVIEFVKGKTYTVVVHGTIQKAKLIDINEDKFLFKDAVGYMKAIYCRTDDDFKAFHTTDQTDEVVAREILEFQL